MDPITRNRVVLAATLAVTLGSAPHDAFSARPSTGVDALSGRVADAEHERLIREGPERNGPEAAIYLPASDSPLGLVLRLGEAYSKQSISHYARGFTTDFRFMFGDRESRERYPDGFTRRDEIFSARHLFEGFTDRDGVHRPGAAGITVRLDSMEVVPDIERPDSSATHQIVIVHRGSLQIELDNGEAIDVGPQRHVFYCVRGDVASLSPGQPSDADHWYVRRWVEVDEAGEPAPNRVASHPEITRIGLAVRPVANPTRPPVSITFSLPEALGAVIDVLDVAGRRVLKRDLVTFQAGTHRLEIDEARALRPGIYWLRLSQGAQSRVARLVIVQ